MDFFAQQARVRGSSRRLVALFVLAVVAIVVTIDAVVWFSMGHHPVDGELAQSNLPLLLASTVAVLAGIGLSSLFRIMSLSGGGKSVAESVGAVPVPPDTRDPQLRQLRNVIEEVAIAAGVPVPDIYLMQAEPGINAFAAGYSTADAAVCVTQGCLDHLNRDELQGVIAHEFSHVLNGDMRLNIRLMGLLFGILVLAIVGRRVIWFGGGRSNRRDGGGQIWMIGLALIVVGYIGYFFGRLIQAAVARSRESLADASAVQFTRQTDGIAGALKKIAILSEGSQLQAANKQEVAHMLFGEAGKFNALFATHPPLLERIRALQPGFREAELAQLAASMQQASTAAPLASVVAKANGASGLPGFSAPRPLPEVLAGAVVASAGASSFAQAGVVHRSIPASLMTAVQQPDAALSVVLALATSAQPDLQLRQRRLIADAFGDDVQQSVSMVFAEVEALAAELRLPLAALAFPALKQLSDGRRQTLSSTLDALVRLDGSVDLDEYCLTRLLRVQLFEAQRPRLTPLDGLKKLPACRDSVALVCAVVAAYGSADEASARRAWLLAMQQIFPGATMPWQAPPVVWQAPFERALDDLDGLLPAGKDLLIQGLASTVHADGAVSVEDAELLRVICASLHCPLPM